MLVVAPLLLELVQEPEGVGVLELYLLLAGPAVLVLLEQVLVLVAGGLALQLFLQHLVLHEQVLPLDGALVVGHVFDEVAQDQLVLAEVVVGLPGGCELPAFGYELPEDHLQQVVQLVYL